MAVKVVWGITGAGDLIRETVGVMASLAESMDIEITAALSKAAAKVVKWYGLTDALNRVSAKVLVEKDANTPFIAGPLQIGKYDGLLVAPATGNTVAKIAAGIADTLVTNAVAQTNKALIPVFILPVDRKKGTTATTLPNGKQMVLTMRDVDVENSDRLRQMAGIRVLDSPDEITAAMGGLPAKRSANG